MPMRTQASMEVLAWCAALACFLAAAGLARGLMSTGAAAESYFPLTYDELYVDGLRAYQGGRWAECTQHLRQALQDYDRARSARLKCYAECRDGRSRTHRAGSTMTEEELNLGGGEGGEGEGSNDDTRDMLMFANRVLGRALCIERCKENFVGVRPMAGTVNTVEEQMERGEPYNYMQMALYKDSHLKEAAKACATFSYLNPMNIHVTANRFFYEALPEVTEEDLKPKFTYAYRDLYAQAMEVQETDWKKMVDLFEASLSLLPDALEECHTYCTGPLGYRGNGGLAEVATNQITAMVECRVGCMEKLGRFRHNAREDFFGSYFHYLQFGYFHLNQSMEAVRASATQVRLEPSNDVAKRNSVFMYQQDGVTQKHFKPREDVLPLIERLEEEQAFLRLLDRLSEEDSDKQSSKESEPSLQQDAPGNDEDLLEEDFQRFPVGVSPKKRETDEADVEPLTSTSDGEGLVIVEGPVDQDGNERLVVDGILTEGECAMLIELASHGTEGDGYPSKSPHTRYEKFIGLNILNAAKAAESGTMDLDSTKLYLNSSKRVKDISASLFKLKQPLYFSYTHLVCRTANEMDQNLRKDHSHPVHADNCILDEASGECNKVPPAYTWRHYSAILYLNSEFEGGNFFFAHSSSDLTPQHYVEPRCGRMVAFSAGKENMHGVKAVTKGTRCAVALWFTQEERYSEAAVKTADDILSKLPAHSQKL